MSPDSDLTARLMELREVLHNEIEAVQTLVTARQDGQDSARQILLDRLRSDTGLLQEELDRRFSEFRKLMDERRDNNVLDGQLIQNEMDRRFADARRENGQRFDATISMRVALQEEMDRRFADLSSQLDRRFTDSERAVQAALAAAKEATGKAEEASNRRFDSVNEFRQTLTDQAGTFLTRAEYDAAHGAVADRITANGDRMGALELRLTSRLDRGDGTTAGAANTRTEQRLNISQVIAVIAVIATVTSLILLTFKK